MFKDYPGKLGMDMDLIDKKIEKLEQISRKYHLPEDYRDFLSKASPLRADFRLRGYHGPVTGYGAQNLIHYQRGYSYNSVEKRVLTVGIKTIL